MTTDRGQHTRSEILSQPRVWAATLAAFRAQAGAVERLWHQRPVGQVLFTGCGSTHYLSLMGAALCQAVLRVTAAARPASELVLFPDLVYAPETERLLIAVSRSGTTTETVEAVRAFRVRERGRVLVITCDPDTPLGQEADVCLAATEAQEQSVAQTRSFSSMALLAQALIGHLAGLDVGVLNSLPDILQRLLDAHHATVREIGEDSGIERFFFLGSGALYGIACEAMLKMKEMSLSYSEAFHTLEFRHGPMSMVNERALVVGLLSEQARTQEIAVLRQMREYGAHVLAVGAALDGEALRAWARAAVELPSGLPIWAQPVLHLPLLQLMAYYRAMTNQQDPDRPAKLQAVVSLDATALSGRV